LAYGGIRWFMTILPFFPKIQELLAILFLPNQNTRLENIIWFLMGDQVSGLLEVLKLRKKNRCFKTRFGRMDGDNFKNPFD
jgi:hypothetical protein